MTTEFDHRSGEKDVVPQAKGQRRRIDENLITVRVGHHLKDTAERHECLCGDQVVASALALVHGERPFEVVAPVDPRQRLGESGPGIEERSHGPGGVHHRRRFVVSCVGRGVRPGVLEAESDLVVQIDLSGRGDQIHDALRYEGVDEPAGARPLVDGEE